MHSTHTWHANTSIRCFDPTCANACLCNFCAIPNSILFLKNMTSIAKDFRLLQAYQDPAEFRVCLTGAVDEEVSTAEQLQ